MFQYALGKTLAIKHNTRLKLDLHHLLDRTPRKDYTFRDYSLNIFRIKQEFCSLDELKQGRPAFKERLLIRAHILSRQPSIRHVHKTEPCVFDQAMLELPDWVYLDGYWQSYRYFQPIDALIRQEFTVQIPLNDIGQGVLSRIGNCGSPVCIHVRRGDFVHNPQHCTCDPEYFQKAVHRVENRVRNPQYFIFSDDPVWCKKNFPSEEQYHVVDPACAGEKASGHFQLMCHCKHFIISNSSFGWWAAYLGGRDDKLVIAPKQWFADAERSANDLIPHTWSRL